MSDTKQPSIGIGGGVGLDGTIYHINVKEPGEYEVSVPGGAVVFKSHNLEECNSFILTTCGGIPAGDLYRRVVYLQGRVETLEAENSLFKDAYFRMRDLRNGLHDQNLLLRTELASETSLKEEAQRQRDGLADALAFYGEVVRLLPTGSIPQELVPKLIEAERDREAALKAAGRL